jgi:hypothetical protein
MIQGMSFNFFNKKNILLACKWMSLNSFGLFYGCNSDIIGIENMQSEIEKGFPILIFRSLKKETKQEKKQEDFDPSNKEHIEILRALDKINIYYEIPGLQCSSDMFSQLNEALYRYHMENFSQNACVFIPIDNLEVQEKPIEKQSNIINKKTDKVRRWLYEEVVKRFKLGENYFDKFRETWIGFSQGGPIAFECWWYVYNQHLSAIKALNHKKYPVHRLVLCNTGLLGCSSLDPLDRIINYIPDEILSPGIKDLSKKSSNKIEAERLEVLNKQNCLLAGCLYNTKEEKEQYVENMFANINLNLGHLKLHNLIIPFLPKGDSCFSQDDQFPTILKERGIECVYLKGHHAESLQIPKNVKILASKIVNWGS